MSKRINVGCFPLGHENVDLFAVTGPSEGACFYLQPNDVSTGRIELGLEYDQFDKVVALLVHEAFEYAAVRAGARFAPDGQLINDHAAYLFAFDHTKFTAIAANVGVYITQAMPRLAEVYNKHKKKWGKT